MLDGSWSVLDGEFHAESDHRVDFCSSWMMFTQLGVLHEDFREVNRFH